MVFYLINRILGAASSMSFVAASAKTVSPSLGRGDRKLPFIPKTLTLIKLMAHIFANLAGLGLALLLVSGVVIIRG